MPKYKVNAYEEVFYKTVIEAKDKDEAEELFIHALGDYHPFQHHHNFEMLQVRKVKESKNA